MFLMWFSFIQRISLSHVLRLMAADPEAVDGYQTLRFGWPPNTKASKESSGLKEIQEDPSHDS